MTKSRLARIAFVAVVAGTAAIVTYLYVTWPPAEGLRHQEFLAPDTAVRAVMQPARIQDYISGLAPVATRFVGGIPRLSSMQAKAIRVDWVHALPREFTFLFDQQTPGILGVILFVSENPESRDFADVLNVSGFFEDLRIVEWTPPQLQELGERMLAAHGAIRVPAFVQASAAAAWPDYVPMEAPQIGGNHLVEIAVDNRNGVLMELHDALRNAYGSWGDPQLHDDLTVICPDILRAHITADLTKDDELTVHARVVCTSQTEGLPLILDELAGQLAAEASLQLDGNTQWAGVSTTEGVYRVSGFEARLRHALGG